jgi:transposase-like protein
MLRFDTYQTFDNFSSATKYLEQPGVTILQNAFEERLSQLLMPRGRKLRRRAKAKTSLKSKPETVVLDKFSQLQRRLPLVSPSSLNYLFDNEAAYDLVDSLRWENKKRACPRCKSRFVLPVRRENRRELYRCVDCHYMFNSLAGTTFQGTKLPVHKFFQFFIAYNALGEEIKMQAICYILQCTFKTASLWLTRGRAFQSPEKFAFVSNHTAARLKGGDPTVDTTDPFFAFCEMKGIVLNEAHFLEYLKNVCRTRLT